MLSDNTSHDKLGSKASLPSVRTASISAVELQGPRQPLSEQQKKDFLNRPGAEPRHLAIALHHAQRIQAQKDTEALILNHILNLVSFPSSAASDPASPSPDDAVTFKSAMISFQPVDYDNLILERNIEGLCGYPLCSRERRGEGGSKPGYRIVWGLKGSGRGGRGRDMKIIPHEKLEMWCSDECAERAMYIRVQLAEQPAWERRTDDTRTKPILLLEEGRASKEAHEDRKIKPDHSSLDIVDGVRRLDTQDSDARSSALALERGDLSQPLLPGRVDVHILEKENVSHSRIKSPERDWQSRMGTSIEGYIPKGCRNTDDACSDSEEDLLDQI